jgi:hypothetical protein
MSENIMGRFNSLSDFNAKLAGLFKGPTFYATFGNLDKRLTKKIMITVSIVNNCTN